MNKQIVIAGLLGAIAAAEGEEDLTPCENVMTAAAAKALAGLEDKLLAAQGQTEGLTETAESEGALYTAAEEAYDNALAVVQPFYTAMTDANEDYLDATSEKSTAQGLITTIADAGEAITVEVTGNTMLSLSKGVSAEAVADALDAIDDAQDAYETLYDEINDDTYNVTTTVASVTTTTPYTGYRKALENAVSNLALEQDAEELAVAAELTAQNAYDAQEQVYVGLLYIQGCESIDTTTYTTTAEETTEYETCCTTQLVNYAAALSSPVTLDCNLAESSVGFGMEKQHKTYKAAETSDATAFTTYCTNATTTDYLDYNCDTDSADGTDTVYTTFKAAKKAYEVLARKIDLVNEACWDGYTYAIGGTVVSSANLGTYDCSNGALSNGNATCATYGSCTAYAASDRADASKLFHLMRAPTDTDLTTTPLAADANFDIIANLRAAGDGTSADVFTPQTAITAGTLSDWDSKYQGLANALRDWTLSEARYYAYKQVLTIHQGLITTADNTEDDLKDTLDQKDDLTDAADAMVQAATKDVSRTTSNLADQVMELGLLQDALTLAHENHAVHTYLLGQATMAESAQQMIVDSWSDQCVDDTADANCYNALTLLENLYETAQDDYAAVATSMDMTYNTATASWDGFYTGVEAETMLSAGMAAEALLENAGTILMLEGLVEAAETAHTAAIATCKGLGFDEAQHAKKALIDLEKANEEAAAEVAIDYAAKAAFATTGETNTLCAFPGGAKDDSNGARPECQDGYCCGAAQKFMKDGTKLAIETCQKAEGVHTYQYYPPLPEGSPVEPTPETWRFQCISGAQKLAATAAAALAASYMMA